MSDYIPPELWPDILAKLPVEDMVRCTGVCKSWYSHISRNGTLISRIASLAKKNSLLFVRNYEYDSQLQDENFSVHLDDNTFSVYKSFDFSFETWMDDYSLVDCLNGVVCLTRKTSSLVDYIILWNPSIRKYLRLPSPIVPSDTLDYPIRTIGFGFDESTNDFKVVTVINYRGRNGGILMHAEVYKISEWCWRRIYPVGLGGVILQPSNQVFLRGAVHWLGTKCGDDEKDLIIVSFDIQNEVFDVTSGPGCLSYTVAWHVCVSMMGESLSLIHRKVCGHNEEHCIWVMKQYGVADSWTKLFTIRSPEGRFWCISYFQKNGDALLAQRGGSALYSYNPIRDSVKELKLFKNEMFDVVHFMESLALFGVKGEMTTVISKGCPDVHSQKKMKIQASEET